MAMVNSGPISLGGNATTGGLNQSVNIELNRTATATINMNESAVRTLAAVPSGAISMSNFYGKSNRVTASATIAANTANYVLNTAKAPGYTAGTTDMTLTINSGIFVSSASTGTAAFIVDTSWAAGDTVTVVNNGTIVGRGGNGGSGGGGFPSINGNPGGGGGTALLVQRALTLNNINRIAGGGGGGGGASAVWGPKAIQWGGGGGGGGIGGSSGGAGGTSPNAPGNPGNPGSLTAAGTGASSFGNPAGNGGGYGSGGNAGTPNAPGVGGGGGASGAAIVGNSNITYIAVGTRNGPIS
jgi:hypothetical protein